MATAAVAGGAATEMVGSTEIVANPAPEAPARVPAPEAPAAPVQLTVVDTPVDEDTVEAEVLTGPVDAHIPAPAERAAVVPEQGADGRVSDEAFAQASSLYPDATPQIPRAAEPIPAEEGELPAYLGTQPRRARSNFRRLTAAAASVGVMAAAGALAVTMCLPAAPFAAAPARAEMLNAAAGDVAPAGGAKVKEPIQAYIASSDVQDPQVSRAENYSTASAADMAKDYGVKYYSTAMFVNDRSAAIQWPFAVGTGYSYGYGMRDGRLHEGIDFTPGEGAEIQSVADGVVRIATENGGGYGVTVYIDHVIDGKVITSHYSHMISGSIRVKEGQRVKVGDVVGLTGNTGNSFGAHLHFELIVNGSTIDPLPWLAKYAGGFQGGKPSGG